MQKNNVNKNVNTINVNKIKYFNDYSGKRFF